MVHCSAIFHFFEMNDVHLNTHKIKRFMPTDEREHYAGDRPYSSDEIRKMLAKCEVRSKVIILLMASTGMRIGGLEKLKIGDLKKNDEFHLYLVWVYNTSKKDRYYTYCTPECAIAIDEYLEYRKLHGEKLKDSSPIIRNQFNIDNPFTAHVPKSVSLRRLAFIVDDVLKQSGVNPIKPGTFRRDECMKSHGLRKFFTNQCDKAQVNFLVRESLLGHRLPGQNASYVRTTEEDTVQEFAKAITLLTICSESRLKQQVQQLQTERFQNIQDIHRKWLTELKGQYPLIPTGEWETMKVEMKYLKNHIIPKLDPILTGSSIHFDANYGDNE
jgi:integrase